MSCEWAPHTELASAAGLPYLQPHAAAGIADASMIATTRRKFSSVCKVQLAIAALKECETLAELSIRFGVAQEMISCWKSALVKNASAAFENADLKH